MENIITIYGTTKVYKSGFQALKGVDLSIEKGEIFALLGPNGAGKTTLISIICGIVNASGGEIKVGGYNIQSQARNARKLIGLVPQELALSMFETVWATVKFTRGLYGKSPNDAYLEKLLRDLSLWDKRDSKIIALSGGMKRRVLIAKALSHEPEVLFLDEPTAGVDVELRKDMWQVIRGLREKGVTIILTTHYIEEAEEMADRIGVIQRGELVLVDEKHALMTKLGRKQIKLQLVEPVDQLPETLTRDGVELSEDRTLLIFEFSSEEEQTLVPSFLKDIVESGIEFKELKTKQSSLEEIFVNLVAEAKSETALTNEQHEGASA